MNAASAKSLATDFATIQVGDIAALERTVTEAEVEAFAKLSGDYNPLHVNEEFAARTSFRRRVAHGMIAASYVSTLVGMHLPGPGALWTQQHFRWRAPVFIGDHLRLKLTVTHKSEGTRTINIAVEARNQNDQIVLEGEGVVMVLEEKKAERDLPLSERVVLVTGGARGIGAAVVRALATAGAHVVINYIRNRTAAEALQSEVGERATIFAADVADADAVQRMTAAAAAQFGRSIDVLINNAGAAITAKPFSETPWSEMQLHLDTQLRGAFHCAQAVLPAMLQAGSGRIINIGSLYTWSAPPANLTAYVTAKAALRAFTKSLAVELGPKGIRVNSVSPGMTETDLIADVPERLRKVQAMQTPLRRLATPEDVAQTVTFLCSNAADFITGADIPVGGGVNLH